MVEMQAEGFRIDPAGDVVDGAGHYHLVVDAACSTAGETIPDDPDHTVTGSCANTGSLTTPLTVEGERTSSGFTFPSTTWGVPGSFTIEADGDTASGTLSGAVPGPATMTIDFDLGCTNGC